MSESFLRRKENLSDGNILERKAANTYTLKNDPAIGNAVSPRSLVNFKKKPIDPQLKLTARHLP